MVICHKNGLLHTHMVCRGCNNWFMEFIVGVLMFSIPTVFRCWFLPRVVSFLFAVVKVTRFSGTFFIIIVHKF